MSDGGLVMAFWSVIFVLVAAILAYWDGMLLPGQMVLSYKRGFPFIANGAMWGNLFLITPVLYMVGKYADQWNGTHVLLTLGLGMAASFAMFYFVYLQGKFPDALAGGGRPISPAGWVMLVYSGIVIAALMMFYVASAPTREEVVGVAALLLCYVIVANHIPLDFLNKHYFFLWCPDIFEEERTPLRIVISSSVLVGVVTVLKLWL